ncbi:hypothetical protein GCM10010915_20620 [Microbacterium faecale]|uniref:Uncharacterized protein n=1 Tax=Microbacterium faecale TaxID=1804630 RepID=A0A916YDY8_9MICO|nr:hypothetical protein GCM10010915_20620 [Microbacterium faecale]
MLSFPHESTYHQGRGEQVAIRRSRDQRHAFERRNCLSKVLLEEIEDENNGPATRRSALERFDEILSVVNASIPRAASSFALARFPCGSDIIDHKCDETHARDE